MFVDREPISVQSELPRYSKRDFVALVAGVAVGLFRVPRPVVILPDSQSPIIHSQTIEVISASALIEAKVPTYYPNGRSLIAPLRKIARAHQRRTGEDVMHNIDRYDASWVDTPQARFLTDPAWGGCFLAAAGERARSILAAFLGTNIEWRVRQGNGETFSVEDIRAIMGVISQGDADIRTFAGKEWTEADEKTIAYLHHAAFEFIGQRREVIAVDRSANNYKWVHAIDGMTMTIRRSLNGPSVVELRLRAANFIEQRRLGYPYREFRFNYRLWEEDLNDPGELISGNVPYKYAFITDPTRSRGFDDGSERDSEATVSHRIRGNIFTGPMLETTRFLVGYSPEQWVTVFGRMPNQF